MSQLINEAFKELNDIKDLDEELFSFDKKGASGLLAFLNADVEPTLNVIDPLATDEDELQPNYDGNVICRCCVCNQLIYKDPKDIIIDEETQKANIDEECPHCYNIGGFDIVGQVEPYYNKEETNVEVDGDKVDIEEKEEISECRKVKKEPSKKLDEAYDGEELDDYIGIKGTFRGFTPSELSRMYKSWNWALKRPMDPEELDDYLELKSFIGKVAEITDVNDFNKAEDPATTFNNSYWTIEVEGSEIAGVAGDRINLHGYFEESLNEDLTQGYVIYDTKSDDYFIGLGKYPSKTKSIHSAIHFDTKEEAQEIINDYISKDEFKDIFKDRWIVKPYSTYYEVWLCDDRGRRIRVLGSFNDIDKAIKYADKIPEKTKILLGQDKEEHMNEDTIKQGNKWVNKGKKGTHGTFKTKKAANAQRKAMYASGYKGESLKEDLENTPDIVLEEDDIILDDRTGDIKVDKDVFNDFVKDAYIRISFDEGETYSEYMMIDEDDNYIYMEWVGGPLNSQNESLRTKKIREDFNNIHFQVSEDDINYFDDETGDILLSQIPTPIISKINPGDYVNIEFIDEDNIETQQYKFLKADDEGYKFEWVGVEINNLDEDLEPDVLMKMNDEELFDYLTLEKGYTRKEAREYINKYFNANLNEDFQKATVETGDSVLSMETTDEGKITVTSEPRKGEEDGEEMIAPVSDEVKAEIENEEEPSEEVEENTEEESTEEVEETVEEEEPVEEEQPTEEETEESDEGIQVEEFEESLFDTLGKKYLQEVYNNVRDFKTMKGYIDGNKIQLEGIITFSSGKQAKTKFLFEGVGISKRGKVKFIGENLQISNKKNAFTLNGSIENGKLLAESLTYNYRTKDASTNKNVRLYGTVRK